MADPTDTLYMTKHTAISEQVAGMRAAAHAARVENLREGRKLRAIAVAPKKGKGAYKRTTKYKGMGE